MVELLLGSVLIGLLPAAIARSRGLDFFTWWLYGALLWPVALIHVFFARPDSVRITGSSLPTRTCPFCAETIQAAATVCKHCGRDLPAVAASKGAVTGPAVIRAGTIGTCARCRRALFPNSVRCGFCGAAITMAK